MRALGLVLVWFLCLAASVRAQAPIEAEVKEIDAFNYLCLPCTGPYTGLPAAVAGFLDRFRRLGIKPIGPLMTVYVNSPLVVKPAELQWEIAYPVSAGQQSVGELVVKRFAYPRVAQALHKGGYATTYTTINALYEWITARGFKTFGGPCVEFYLDADPARVPDAEKRTLVAVPVRTSR